MESRGRRPRSPERQRPAVRKVPVVYYLTRSRHLEHPHFVEVPVFSPEGLYLRDVLNHLNMVRGKGMAAMYSWSCKRSYKNGFVWHDLAEDDLIIPATDDEYVLKGSELLEQSPSGQLYNGNGNQKQQSSRFNAQKEATRLPLSTEASFSSSPPSVIVREAKLRHSRSVSFQEEVQSPLPCRSGSLENISPESEPQRPLLSGNGSASPAECRVYKPTGSVDAATQTEDSGKRSVQKSLETHHKTLSSDNDSVVREITECCQNQPRRSGECQEIAREVMSQCATPLSVSSARGKSESLESLIRADANMMNSIRIPEEDDIVMPTCPKLRPANVLMQLITCGSITVKDHDNLGLVETYKTRFQNLKFPSPLISRTVMMRELDYLSENPRLMGLRLEDKEYFSGSLIETKMHKEVAGERYPMLKRSSSYNAERSAEPLDCAARPEEEPVNTSRSRCLPRTAILSSFLHPKSEMLKSPISECRRSSSAGPDSSLASGEGSNRLTDTSGASMRLESFRKEKEKLVKIEES